MGATKEFMAVAALITEHRQKAGLTKAQLARALGFTGSTYVIMVEAAQRRPSMKLIEGMIRIVKLTGGEAEELRDAARWLHTSGEGRELIEKARRRSVAALGLAGKAVPIRYIPVVASHPAGEEMMGPNPTGLQATEYVSVAEELVREYPGAFALRMDDDAMSPRFNTGDFVIAALSRDAEQGKAALVMLKMADREPEILCRLWYKAGKMVSLVAASPAVEPMVIQEDAVAWAHAVVVSARREM